MKKFLPLALTLLTMSSFWGCQQIKTEADRIKEDTQELYEKTAAEVEKMKNDAIEAKEKTEEKIQQVQDAADAIKKLSE